MWRLPEPAPGRCASAGPWLKPQSLPGGTPRHRSHPRHAQSSQSAHTCTKQKHLPRCLRVCCAWRARCHIYLHISAELAAYFLWSIVLTCCSARDSAAQQLKATPHHATLYRQDSHLSIRKLWRIAGINVPSRCWDLTRQAGASRDASPEALAARQVACHVSILLTGIPCREAGNLCGRYCWHVRHCKTISLHNESFLSSALCKKTSVMFSDKITAQQQSHGPTNVCVCD